MAIRRPVDEPCTVGGCTRARRSRMGLHCRHHADRLRRHGTLEDPAAPAESVRSGGRTSAHTAPEPAAHTAIVTPLPTSAGRGTAQQRARARVRPNVRADGSLGGFDLPEGVLPKGQEWHARTIAWWESWRSSPQASRMLTAPDWDYLLDTALLHHGMWCTGRFDLAAEVRQRVAAFGATPADRARLRFEVEIPEPAPAGTAGRDPGTTRTDAQRDRWQSAPGTPASVSAVPATEQRQRTTPSRRRPSPAAEVPDDGRSLDELRDLLAARGLAVSGPRRALLARLQASDTRSTGSTDAAPFDL